MKTNFKFEPGTQAMIIETGVIMVVAFARIDRDDNREYSFEKEGMPFSRWYKEEELREA